MHVMQHDMTSLLLR